MDDLFLPGAFKKKRKIPLGDDRPVGDHFYIKKGVTREEWGWIQQMRKSRACSIKVDYDTEQDAVLAARYQMDRHGTVLRTYKCDVCRFFHITSQLPE